jgi:hypothetical protein
MEGGGGQNMPKPKPDILLRVFPLCTGFSVLHAVENIKKRNACDKEDKQEG